MPSRANFVGLVTVVAVAVLELLSELLFTPAPPRLDAFELIEAAAADDVDEDDEPAARVEGDLIDDDRPTVSVFVLPKLEEPEPFEPGSAGSLEVPFVIAFVSAAETLPLVLLLLLLPTAPLLLAALLELFEMRRFLNILCIIVSLVCSAFSARRELLLEPPPAAAALLGMEVAPPPPALAWLGANCAAPVLVGG